jgi:hypothetical protein
MRSLDGSFMILGCQVFLSSAKVQLRSVPLSQWNDKCETNDRSNLDKLCHEELFTEKKQDTDDPKVGLMV